MMNVVVVDVIPRRRARPVTPRPADGNARVIEIGDLVVGDVVVAALPEPDADGAREHAPAVTNDAVVDRDVIGAFLRLRRDAALADADAARAQVVRFAALHRAVVTAAAEPN